MKREYFGMIFIIAFVLLILLAEYMIGEQVWDYVSTFIVIWILIGFYVGQHSMKYPKAF